MIIPIKEVKSAGEKMPWRWGISMRQSQEIVHSHLDLRSRIMTKDGYALSPQILDDSQAWEGWRGEVNKKKRSGLPQHL